MKKLLLTALLLSLQVAVNATTEGTCCSSCPAPKVEVKKKRAKKNKEVVLPVVEKEETSLENVVEAEVEASNDEEVSFEVEELA